MTWKPAYPGAMCTHTWGEYEIRGAYTNGRFEFRGLHVPSDRLVSASADRNLVELVCERHAAAALAEGTS